LRHLVIMLLCCLLPLQGAWSLAAQFCLHHADGQQNHWGHHQHSPHHGDQSEYQEIDSKKMPIDHDDHTLTADTLFELLAFTEPLSRHIQSTPPILAPPFYRSPNIEIPIPPSRLPHGSHHRGRLVALDI